MRILIVEDEVFTAMWLEAILTDMGHEIVGKSVSGEDAIVQALDKKPDLITMDINLAGNTHGIEAARHIQKTERIPIIFMTGYVDKHYQEESRDIYSIAFLFKPVTAEVLGQLIDKYLNTN